MLSDWRWCQPAYFFGRRLAQVFCDFFFHTAALLAPANPSPNREHKPQRGGDAQCQKQIKNSSNHFIVGKIKRASSSLSVQRFLAR
jgi:hypothetical protein